MKLVIGIAGEKFSGKNDTCLFLEKWLASHGYTLRRISSGELIGSVGLSPWKIPTTNKNRQRFAQLLVDESWEGMTEGERRAIISNVMRDEMEKSAQDVVVFDGLRWPPDIELIRSFPQNLILYISASFETRRMRTASRTEKVGEGMLMTEEEFRELNQRPTETWIPKIKKLADYRIENERTKEELRDLVRVVIEAGILSRLQKP